MSHFGFWRVDKLYNTYTQEFADSKPLQDMEEKLYLEYDMLWREEDKPLIDTQWFCEEFVLVLGWKEE